MRWGDLGTGVAEFNLVHARWLGLVLSAGVVSVLEAAPKPTVLDTLSRITFITLINDWLGQPMRLRFWGEGRQER
jgi:hypothetical protein